VREPGGRGGSQCGRTIRRRSVEARESEAEVVEDAVAV
jgi:hypothetical protein